MSTNLEKGLKLKNPSQDLFEVFSILHKAIEKAHQQAMIDLVSENIAYYIESHYDELLENPTRSIFAEASEAWGKQQKSFGAHHTLNDPLRFSMVFGKSADGSVLAYPYYINEFYTEAISVTGIFEAYGYWNSCDGPDDVPYGEFEERARQWKSIESEDGNFSHLPLYQISTKNAFDQFWWWRLEERELLPKLDHYMTPKKRFYDRLQSEIFKSLKSKGRVGDKVFDTFWQVRDVVNKYEKEVGFDESLYPKLFNKNMFIEIEELPEVKDYSALCETLIIYGEL